MTLYNTNTDKKKRVTNKTLYIQYNTIHFITSLHYLLFL